MSLQFAHRGKLRKTYKTRRLHKHKQVQIFFKPKQKFSTSPSFCKNFKMLNKTHLYLLYFYMISFHTLLNFFPEYPLAKRDISFFKFNMFLIGVLCFKSPGPVGQTLDSAIYPLDKSLSRGMDTSLGKEIALSISRTTGP